MNVLYFSNVNISSPLAAGVYKKIVAQKKTMEKEGIDVFLACYQDEQSYFLTDPQGKIVETIHMRGAVGNQRSAKICESLLALFDRFQWDVIYSRFETFSLRIAAFYRKAQKRGARVLLEVPTYPLTQRWTSIGSNLKNGNIIRALRQIYNATINTLGITRFRTCVERIVTNNGYDEIWHVPTIRIHNGVDIDSVKVKKQSSKRGTINLIAVANLAKWHGYDRILKGMATYYSRNATDSYNIHFHIVGKGLELQNLENFTRQYQIEEHVTFYGNVVGDDLDRLFDKADIGVAILGAYRSHMKSCDSLKSKEYCARHIPFITSTIEATYCGLAFVLMVPDDSTIIDCDKIIDFYEQTTNNEKLDEEMARFAKAYCDWSVTFKNVINYIKG